MKALALALFLCACSVEPAASKTDAQDARAWRTARSVEKAFAEGSGDKQLELAIGSIIRTAQRTLRERGHFLEASRLGDEWTGMQSRLFTLKGARPEDMGDHDALSQWLVDKYLELEALLGPTTMHLLHLSDIYVINYGVPVVFKPHASEKWCLDTLAAHQDGCEPEYRRHFAGTLWQKSQDQWAKDPLHDGLIPVIAYWVAWGICEAATYGTGWFVICSPIGDACEIVMERYIAPPLSDKVYEKANAK